MLKRKYNGRFLEIGTNKPLYYDRDRIRVDSLHQLSLERSSGYAYETDLKKALDAAELRFHQVSDQVAATPKPDQETALNELAANVREIIKNQHHSNLGKGITRHMHSGSQKLRRSFLAPRFLASDSDQENS